MNGKDNRRSFRVVEAVYLQYEKITDSEFRHGIERWKISRGAGLGIRSKLLDIDARFNEKLYLLKTDSVALAECLTLLNEKINTLLDEPPRLRQSKAALANQVPQTCELGAEGMAFGTSEKIELDSKLALRFLLSADNRYVETFCRVVRQVDPPDADEGHQYGVAVEFQGMKSAEKDILIQHMFDRESETLRMRRLQMEEAELEALTRKR